MRYSNIKNRFINVMFFVFLSGIISAQVQKIGIPEIEYFNRREYNGATQNWKITQGESGMLYFANNDGVLEFDGSDWRRYNEFGNAIVRSVKSINSKIYIGSYNELGYYDYDHQSILTYKSLVQDPGIRELGDIWSIHQWEGKVVFLSQKGLCVFKDDQFQHIIQPKTIFISAFVVNGLLLVQDEELGLMEVRGDKAYPVSGGTSVKGKVVSAIMSLSETEILIGTINDGFFVWDMHRIYPWQVESNELFKKINVFCGIKYSDDLFAIGTIQGGLVVIDRQGRVFMQTDKDKGLRNNTVLSVFADREGNIWGGLDNGIVKVNFNAGISFLQGYYDIGTGYSIEKFKGGYYFGTNQALYTISERGFVNPLKKRDDFELVKGTEGQVWSMYKDESNLLCGHHQGAYVVSGSNSSLITPQDVNGVWNFKPVKEEPDLLISGTYTGLIVFEKKGNKWTFRNKVKGFGESARFIEWDDEGNLWVSHGYHGLYQLKLDDQFNEVLSQVNYKNADVGDNTVSLELTKIDGKCKFIGRDGVYKKSTGTKFFERDTSFDSFFKKGGFPNAIYQDEYRNLWCFVNETVMVLRYLEDGSYREILYPFLPLEKKLVNAFEFLYVDDKSNVFFGIEDGFAHYSADELKSYNKPFAVHIRSFKEANDSVVYQRNVRGANQDVIPVFAFKRNAIEIDFTASFYENRDLQYLCRLKGYENYSSGWQKGNQVNYANLHEGNYVFEVKAKNRYGVESLPLQFKFVVLPPWHRSVPVKIAFVVLFVVLLALVYYFFSRRIELSRHKEKEKQQQRFKAREERLKSAALESEKEMVKVRNEKLRGEMVFKEKELANSTINLIQKNELLSEIKAQLKKIVRIRDFNDLEKKIASLVKKIDKDIDNENNWEVFEMHFGQVHEEFLKRLAELHPDLSQREQKLSAFIRMGMSSKEIASLMNITTRAVENNRYKLRQKLGIEHGDNLSAYIAKL